MQLGATLEFLYPETVPGLDWAVTLTGDGPEITHWDEVKMGPQPTVEELETGWLQAFKRRKRVELIHAFDSDYAGLWSIDGEVIEAWKDRILATAPTNRTVAQNAKLSQAVALFDQLQTKLANIRDAQSEADVSAITWNS